MTEDGAIRTERLRLRPLRPGDAEEIARGKGNFDVARWLAAPPWPCGLQEVRDFLASQAAGEALEEHAALSPGADPPGRLGRLDRRQRRCRTGNPPCAAPRMRGPGLGSEAVAAFTGVLFRRFDIPALAAGVFTDNAASVRVPEKPGFRRMGEEIHGSKGRLAPAPLWVYRLERPSTPV